MSEEIKEETVDVSVVKVPVSETIADTPEKEPSILEILGEPSEKKPEFFETQEEINENLPDFDPPEPKQEVPESPPPSEPDPGKRKVSKNVFSAGSKLASPIIVEVVDSIVPPIFGFIAKTKDYEQFCATPEAKKDLAEALTAYLDTKDVELSPGWVLIMALVAAYAPSGILAYELRQTHAKLAKQEKVIDAANAKQKELDRQRIDAEKREQEALRELNEIKLKNAELSKQAAATEIAAKRMAVKDVKPARQRKPTVKPKK